MFVSPASAIYIAFNTTLSKPLTVFHVSLTVAFKVRSAVFPILQLGSEVVKAMQEDKDGADFLRPNLAL